MVTWMRSPSSSFMTARRPFDIRGAEFSTMGGLDRTPWNVLTAVGQAPNLAAWIAARALRR